MFRTPGVIYMTLNASKFGPLNKGVMMISDFMKRKIDSSTPSNDVQVVHISIQDKPKVEVDECCVPAKKKKRADSASKPQTKKKAKAKEVKSKSKKPDDSKQLKLNFMAVPRVQDSSTPNLDTTIEVSSDSDAGILCKFLLL